MSRTTDQHEDRRSRPGFTIVEVLVAVLILGVLAAIAFPSYQKVTYRARAAKIVGDLYAVRNAAYHFHLDRGQWPPNVSRGLPSGMEEYVSGVQEEGSGYALDWDNWDPTIGISVVVSDPLLEGALVATLKTSEGTFVRLSDRYMFIVTAESAP